MPLVADTISPDDCFYFNPLPIGVIDEDKKTKTGVDPHENWSAVVAKPIPLPPEANWAVANVSTIKIYYKSEISHCTLWGFYAIRAFKENNSVMISNQGGTRLVDLQGLTDTVYLTEGPPDKDWIVWGWERAGSLRGDDFNEQKKQFEQFYSLLKKTSDEIFNEFNRHKPEQLGDLMETINKFISNYLVMEDLNKLRTLLKAVVEVFPDIEYYKIAQRIVAPPKLIDFSESETEGIKETISFLKKEGNRFSNKWIAISQGRLLGISDSYRGLVQNYNDKNVIITRVG